MQHSSIWNGIPTAININIIKNPDLHEQILVQKQAEAGTPSKRA